MSTQVLSPFPLFTSIIGVPLNLGWIYIGDANQDPETNPQQAYWDIGLTVPATQPLRTNGGYIVNAGDAATVYVAGAFSIRVRSNNGGSPGTQVFYRANVSSMDALRDDLASTATDEGAGLIGFSQSADYDAATLGRHGQATISVDDHPFLAVGDGTTDDTAAIQAAIDYLGALGGSVIIPNTFKCLIDSNLTVKPNVSLIGPHRFVGSPADNTSAPYGSLGGALIINSAATITLKGGASVSGLLIYRKGMTFPAADSSAFAGTALTGGDDDVALASVMVLGFNKGFYSTGNQRPRITDWYGDNINGIEIANCADIAYLTRVHNWPFATIAALGAASTLQRTGNAIYLHDVCDWAHLTDCFSYGYLIGIKVANANSVNIVSCGVDNTYSGGPLHTNSKGIDISGTSSDTRIVNCQAAAQDLSGINVNTDGGKQTQIISLNCWGGTDDGVTVAGGDVQIIGGIMGGLVGITNGVTITSASSNVSIDGVKFATLSNRPVNPTVATSLIFIGKNDYGVSTAVVGGSNLTTAAVASASAISAPSSYEVLDITGTTDIGTINGGWAGRLLTLVFGGVLSMLHSTGGYGALRLSGAVNFATTAGGTLTLRHDGVQWYEVGRSA